MSAEVAAGAVLLVAPIWFNVNFALLGKRFDYPDILRRPTAEVLERFQVGGAGLIVLWWTFMLSGLLLIAAAVLLGHVLGLARAVVLLATTIGVLAGLVQMLGLLRWVYVVPSLARGYSDESLGREERDAHAVVFRALHQYLGVGVGEHLGYLFTGIWSVLTGLAIVGSESVPSWLGWVGLVTGAGLALGSAEFLGSNEERGWKLAGSAIPFLYIAWSLWLLALGIVLIV